MFFINVCFRKTSINGIKNLASSLIPDTYNYVCISICLQKGIFRVHVAYLRIQPHSVLLLVFCNLRIAQSLTGSTAIHCYIGNQGNQPSHVKWKNTELSELLLFIEIIQPFDQSMCLLTYTSLSSCNLFT